MYAVPDAATLQRWVLEQRVSREDAVSLHGMRWTPLGERPDFAVFFAASDRLASSGPTLSPAPSPLPSRPAPRELPPAPRHDEEIFVETTDVAVESSSDGFSGVDELPAGMAAHAFGPYDPVRPSSEDESATVVERADSWRSESSPAPAYTPPYAPSAHERNLGPEPETQEATIESRRQDGLSGWLEREAEPTVAHPRGARAPTVPPRSGRIPTPSRPGGLTSASTLSPMPPPPQPSNDPFFSGTPMVTITPRNANDVFEDAQPARQGNTMLWIAVGLGAFAFLSLGAVLVFGGGFALTRTHPPPPAVNAPVDPPPGAPTPSASGPVSPEPTAIAPPTSDPATAPPAAADAAAKQAADAAAQDAADAAAKQAADAAAKADAEAKQAAYLAEKQAAEKAAKQAAQKSANDAGTAAGPPATPKTAAKAADGGGSVKSLTDSGWKAIDKGDLPKAHGFFSRALQKDPNSAWALYGRGYANEKMGDAVSARSDYCDAMTAGAADTELRRELDGGLRRLGQRCN